MEQAPKKKKTTGTEYICLYCGERFSMPKVYWNNADGFESTCPVCKDSNLKEVEKSARNVYGYEKD